MKVKVSLLVGGNGAVLADESRGVVRLWTLVEPFRDGRVLRALRRFFPDLKVRGRIIRLGGFRSLTEAHGSLVEAKMTSSSLAVRRLFRYDFPESLVTIRHYL